MSTSGEDQQFERRHQLSQFKFELLHPPPHSHIPTATTTFSPFPLHPPPHLHPHSHSAFPNLSSLNQRYEINNFKSQTSNTEVSPSHTRTVNLPPLQPESGIRRKYQSKAKASRNAKSGTHPSNIESPNTTAVNNCRYDSSLGLLTKKFVSLIQEAKDGTLDLNKTAEILQVQKRRIYDITNVLEGIGLIEKTSKNHIRWKADDGLGPRDLDDQVTRLKAEVESLYAEECELEGFIRKKQELIRNLEGGENSRKYLFLTKEDILSLPCLQNQELIAIKAPKASFIEVPDPDEELGFRQRQCKMTIRSATGPISLHLLSKHNSKFEDDNIKQVKLIDPSWNSERCRMRGADQKNTSQSFNSMGSEEFEIQEITPTDFEVDDDYWFPSDPGVSLTEMWGGSNF